MAVDAVEQTILNILYADLGVAVYDEYSVSIEGREEAAKRIMDEIIHRPINWQTIEYGHDDKGSILLPEGAPFDGRPVLIKTNTGIVEAWWCVGEWSDETPDHPREYDGWYWVCYDDQFHVDLDEAKAWMPIPQ